MGDSDQIRSVKTSSNYHPLLLGKTAQPGVTLEKKTKPKTCSMLLVKSHI